MTYWQKEKAGERVAMISATKPPKNEDSVIPVNEVNEVKKRINQL
jgi:hypothetical protein